MKHTDQNLVRVTDSHLGYARWLGNKLVMCSANDEYAFRIYGEVGPVEEPPKSSQTLEERMAAVQIRLEERGVRDIKVTLAPDVAGKSAEKINLEAIEFLEDYLDGKTNLIDASTLDARGWYYRSPKGTEFAMLDRMTKLQRQANNWDDKTWVEIRLGPVKGKKEG